MLDGESQDLGQSQHGVMFPHTDLQTITNLLNTEQQLKTAGGAGGGDRFEKGIGSYYLRTLQMERRKAEAAKRNTWEEKKAGQGSQPDRQVEINRRIQSGASLASSCCPVQLLPLQGKSCFDVVCSLTALIVRVNKHHLGVTEYLPLLELLNRTGRASVERNCIILPAYHATGVA